LGIFPENPGLILVRNLVLLTLLNHFAHEENALDGRFAIVDHGEPFELFAAFAFGAESDMDVSFATRQDGLFGEVGAGAGAGWFDRLDEEGLLANVPEQEVVEDGVTFGDQAVVEFGFGELDDRHAVTGSGEVESALGPEARDGDHSKKEENCLFHHGEGTQNVGQYCVGGG
jgi:hypothetical protein